MTLMILREVNWGAYRRFVSGYGAAFDAARGLKAIDMSFKRPPLVAKGHVLLRMELVLLLARHKGREPILNDEFWNRYATAGREEDGKRLRELYGQFLGRILGNEPDIEYLAGLIEMTTFDPPDEPDALDFAA